MKLTQEQIDNFNYNQHNANIHPLTCPGNKPECNSHRELIATEDCLVCHCGEYKQEVSGWMSFVLDEKRETAKEMFERVINENKGSK